MPHARSHFLALKPPKKHTDRSSNIMEGKYQKLCRHSNWIFPSNKVISMPRTGFEMRNLIVDFWEGIGVWRLLRVQTENTAAPPLHDCIRSAFATVNRSLISMYSMLSLHFCAIVAVVESEVDRLHAPKVDFCELHEREVKSKASTAKVHTY